MPAETFQQARWKAWGTGLGVCLVVPLAAGALAFAGIFPPGQYPVAGATQQLGYSFTALTFLAAAAMAWRRVRFLQAFRSLEEAARVAALHREARLLVLLSLSTTLWGTLYWTLVGLHAVRHVLTFLVLTPVMFLCFMPRPPAKNPSPKETP